MTTGPRNRGFALFAALWLVVTCTALVALALESGRLAVGAGTQRVRAARAEWALRACVEQLRAGVAEGRPLADVARRPVGERAWCAVRLEDPGALLPIDAASEAVLRRYFGDEVAIAPLLDWRDSDETPRADGAERAWYEEHGRAVPPNGLLHDVRALRLVRGFEAIGDRQLAQLTVGNGGRVHLNAASAPVLRALPGASEELVEAVLRRRDQGGVRDADDLLGELSPAARLELLASYAAFMELVAFAPVQLRVHVTAGAGAPLVVRATLTVDTAQGRLAVLRQVPG